MPRTLNRYIVKTITDAADGRDPIVIAKLLADVAEMHIDHAHISKIFTAPNLLQQLLAGQYAPAVFSQGIEQIELKCRQVNGDIIHKHCASICINQNMLE